jgi:PST family polysaccharide transporter
MLASAFSYLSLNGDNFVVGRRLGASSLGIYSRAYRVLMMPIDLLNLAMNAAVLPLLAHVSHDLARVRRGYLTGAGAAITIAAPVAVVGYFLIPSAVRILLGTKWSDTIVPIQIFIWCMPFRLTYKIMHAAITALGMMVNLALVQLAYAIFVIGGAWMGAQWGLNGVCVAVGLAVFACYLLSALVVNGRLSIPLLEFGALHRPALIASAFLALCLAGAEQLGLRTLFPLAHLLALGVLSLALWMLASLLWPKFFIGPALALVVRQSVKDLALVQRLAPTHALRVYLDRVTGWLSAEPPGRGPTDARAADAG